MATIEKEENVNEFIERKINECVKLVEYIETVIAENKSDLQFALNCESMIRCLDKDNGVGSDEGVFDESSSFINCNKDDLVNILDAKIKQIEEKLPSAFPEMNTDFLTLLKKKREMLKNKFNSSIEIADLLIDYNAFDTYGKKIMYSNISSEIASELLIGLLDDDNFNVCDIFYNPDERFAQIDTQARCEGIRDYLKSNKKATDRLLERADIYDREGLDDYGIIICDEPSSIYEIIGQNYDAFDNCVESLITRILSRDKFKNLPYEERNQYINYLLDKLNKEGDYGIALTNLVDLPIVDFEHTLRALEEDICMSIPSEYDFSHLFYATLTKAKTAEELKELLEKVKFGIAEMKKEFYDTSSKIHALEFTVKIVKSAIDIKSRQ